MAMTPPAHISIFKAFLEYLVSSSISLGEKVFAFGFLVVYLLSPLDLIPEALFGPIGVTDDLGALILFMFFARWRLEKMTSIPTDAAESAPDDEQAREEARQEAKKNATPIMLESTKED